MSADLSLPTLLFVAAAALAAGAVDAIGGGGGLITLPALLAAGLPAPLALGTNKGQGVFGSGGALWRYARAGLVDGRTARVSFPAGLLGSLLGAGLVLLVPPAALRPMVLVLLLLVAVVLAFPPYAPAAHRRAPPAPHAGGGGHRRRHRRLRRLLRAGHHGRSLCSDCRARYTCSG